MPPRLSSPRPAWQTSDALTARFWQGDARVVLRSLPAGSVQTIVTSPPYWGLRDYGTAGQLGAEPSPDCGTVGQAQCGGCYVCNMVAVFREARRVLRDDGTLWLNLGDTYGGGSGQNFKGGASRGLHVNEEQSSEGYYGHKKGLPSGLPSGNLVGVPWRTALALQRDGWVLRQDIIWHKPAPMPESVRNRCTKAHEYVFLLAKGKGYYYDAEAVKEKSKTSQPGEPSYRANGKTRTNPKYSDGIGGQSGLDVGPGIVQQFSNKRSVWTVGPQPYPGAHFATFPPKLIEPMIRAGSREGDVVLDPFAGAGTTALTALDLGRRAWGIELSAEYLAWHVVPRLEGFFLGRPGLKSLLPGRDFPGKKGEGKIVGEILG
jgi:DNA modification methylase